MIRPKILVVEDERIVALHLKQQLTGLGYDVVAVVASGDAALAAAEANHPDLVLMDIHIEGRLDGIETAALLPADLPVVYLTAYSEETALERAKATKPYGYLIKPYSERELHATIQMALERRRVAAALRLSEDRYRSIVGAINDAIFIVTPDGRVIREANAAAARMFDYAPGELIDLTLVDLSSTEEAFAAQGADDWVAKATACGPLGFEWRCRTQGGRPFWAEVSFQVAAIGGQRTGVAIVRETTERRAIEEQLRQSQKMEAIGQLTGGLAHDFNNLLGVIIGNLDLLRDLRPDDAELADLAGDALEAALGGAELTRRLLAFARRQPLLPQSIDVQTLVADTVKLLRRLLGDNIEVSLNFDEAACNALADGGQLKAALTNLATNARDAMPNGGKLLITTGRRHLDADYASHHLEVTPGDYAMIEVSDTGVGIAADVVDSIFEPFFTTKARERGTGLGLSMVYGFLKQSGGHVSVYSEVGVGTTFRLYLPCAGAPAEARTPTVVSDASPGRGETVLVVEDRKSLRRVAVRQFEQLGYRALEAENGAEALTQLERAGVDLLFTDIVMPGEMDGLALAAAALARWPNLRVILTSGFPETRLGDQLASARHRLLTKPYRREDLARIVRETLDAPGVEAG